MPQIQVPAGLSKPERKAFRKVAQNLARQGVEPSTRAMLIEELVRLESRLEGLRTAEKQAENASKIAASRALNVATAERRRLHDAVFKGARVLSTEQAAAGQAGAQGESEADAAWRGFFRSERDRQLPPEPAARAAMERELKEQEAAVTARFGEASWSALLYATHAEAVEAERIIEARARRQPAEPRAMREEAMGAPAAE